MKQKNKTLIFNGILMSALILLDQWTKKIAVNQLMGKPAVVVIENVFEFQYLENRGAAFGVLQNQQGFFFLMTTVVLLFGVYAYMKIPFTKKYFLLHLCLAGLSAGAIGNMIDRVRQGYVVDFLYFKLINFPIFNVADCYVTLFTIFLVFLILFVYKEEDLQLFFREKKEVL